MIQYTHRGPWVLRVWHRAAAHTPQHNIILSHGSRRPDTGPTQFLTVPPLVERNSERPKEPVIGSGRRCTTVQLYSGHCTVVRREPTQFGSRVQRGWTSRPLPSSFCEVVAKVGNENNWSTQVQTWKSVTVRIVNLNSFNGLVINLFVVNHGESKINL